MNSPIHITPNSKSNALKIRVGSGIFVILGFFMFVIGQPFVGFAVLVFFGWIFVSAPAKVKARIRTLTLTDEALIQRYPEGDTKLLWDDVDEVGLFSIHSNTFVGLRLKSYDRYLATFSAIQVADAKRSFKIIKVVKYSLSQADLPLAYKLWSRFKGVDIEKDLDALGQVGELGQSMLWSRSKYSYDIGLGWIDLDRKPQDFLKLLEHCTNKKQNKP